MLAIDSSDAAAVAGLFKPERACLHWWGMVYYIRKLFQEEIEYLEELDSNLIW